MKGTTAGIGATQLLGDQQPIDQVLVPSDQVSGLRALEGRPSPSCRGLKLLRPSATGLAISRSSARAGGQSERKHDDILRRPRDVGTG